MLDESLTALVSRYCLRDDLSTFDPYDLWKTKLGFLIKNLFNCHRRLGIVPAITMSLFDTYINNRTRFFYRKQEYPIVRAWAALILLNVYRTDPKEIYLDHAKKHLAWLCRNAARGYKGKGWGIGFDLPISCELVYDANTPFATITPYVLEALVTYSEITGRREFDSIINETKNFFDVDLQIMSESDSQLATSYGPLRDRIVVNAVSYAMYSYSLFLRWGLSDTDGQIRDRIARLYNFVGAKQNCDGSWYYSPEGKSFIDCFHSAIVIKNIVKTDQIVKLDGATEMASSAYRYLKENLFDSNHGLFRRFSVKNKPSIVRFDLYDNAEALNLAILLNDIAFADRLKSAIARKFHRGPTICSQVGFMGEGQNNEMLRWAIMPYLYALSCYESKVGL
jgi:hypothetical protein